jgi:hypothetical protein
VFLRSFDDEKYEEEEGRRLTRLKRYEVPGSTWARQVLALKLDWNLETQLFWDELQLLQRMC